MNGGLSVRAQFDGARSTPAFVHADVRQSARGQLPDRWTAIDVVDRLQIDVEGEIEVPRQSFEAVRPLLRRHGSGQHVDPVAPDDADREIAANFEQGLAELLRLAVHLPAMRDANIRRQKEIRRIGAGDVCAGQPAADRDVALAIGAEPIDIVHAVHVGEHDVGGRLERRRQNSCDGRLAGSPRERQHLYIAEGKRERRDRRRIPGRRESRRHDVFDGETSETAATQVFSGHSPSTAKFSRPSYTSSRRPERAER